MNKSHRWNAGIGFDFINQILKQENKSKIIMVNSPFGKLSDYYDLEGIIFPEKIKLTNLFFENVTLLKSKITLAWMEKNIFKNVLFNDLIFDGVSDHGNVFENCSFFNTKYKNSVLGYDGSKYKSCKFVKASFNKVNFIRAEFINCEFIDCKLTGIDFNASSFESCSFSGFLEDIWFRGGYKFEKDIEQFGKPKKNKMLNVSFENASLLNVIFTNDCDLSYIKLPKKDSYLIIDNWTKKLEGMEKNKIKLDDSQRKKLEIFIGSWKLHAKNQNMFLFNFNEIKEQFGEGVFKFMLDFLVGK